MNAAIKFSVKEQLVTKECGTCGIIYAVPEKWLERRREGLDGTREFYCPNGHCRYFTGETTESKLRRELEQAQKTASAAMQRAWVAEQAQRAAKEKLGKLSKRSSAGVCPCCHRTFSQMARHMKTKHPDYVKTS